MRTHDLAHAAIAIAVVTTTATADTSLFDGFGDADRDNNGSLEGTPDNPADTGIEWYAIGGFTSTALIKPALTIVDDPTIGSGNALLSRGRGSNSELAAFFGQRMSLGTAIGDRLVLSFGLRLQDDQEPLSDLTATSEFRFGLYTDADNELGTAGWGTSDGDFDSGSPGTGGDSGFFFRTPLAATTPVDFATRVVYEPTNADAIIGGLGTESIRVESGFGGIFDTSAHSIQVIFERIAGAPGEDLLITYTIDGNSFSVDTVGENLPSSIDIASFDYFVATMTDDMDWVIDNFSISTVSIPAPGAAALIGLGALAANRRRSR